MKLPAKVNVSSSTLLTDWYQLTMLQAYMEAGMEDTSVFEFFVRNIPPQRKFFMAAGLEQVVDFLEGLRFAPWELEWISESGRFSQSFVDYLEKLRFTGDLHAMCEGTVFFPNEPIARISAPLPQAQLVETRLINLLHYQTVVASKAARMVLAASGKPVIDFGLRRAHGAEAGYLAARASYMAGFDGTATVLAGALFDIPVFGTMAHSFIQAHAQEFDAFHHFADAQPDNVILLLDTYDTEEGARNVVKMFPGLHKKGITIKGVRLDSGDLADHARKVRSILDAGGLYDTQITGSGNLDEYAIQALARSQAPIDQFAVGTKLTTSADGPYLDCAYKLQEYAGRACRKKAEGKETWPGPKQVYRNYDHHHRIAFDVVTVEDDRPGGEALIQPVMKAGTRLGSLPALRKAREHAANQMSHLPDSLRELTQDTAMEVRISQALQDLARQVDRQQGI